MRNISDLTIKLESTTKNTISENCFCKLSLCNKVRIAALSCIEVVLGHAACISGYRLVKILNDVKMVIMTFAAFGVLAFSGGEWRCSSPDFLLRNNAIG